MAFTGKLSESFGKPLEMSPYHASDPIVKASHVAKGNNLIFGRSSAGDNYTNLVYLGKVLENSPGKNLFANDAWLDVTLPHVIYITGTRGSGKSFDLGILVEGISVLTQESAIQKDITPITSIVIDTQSQFWTLGYEPRPTVHANAEQLSELQRWNISPNSLANYRLLKPPGGDCFLGDEVEFRIRPRDVAHGDWCALLGQEVYGPQGYILGETTEQFSGTDYSIDDMVDFIGDDDNWRGVPESSRNALSYRLSEYRRSGLFHPNGMDMLDLLKPGVCSVFMLRELRNVDKSLVTAIIARRLFSIMGEYHRKQKVSEFLGESRESTSMPTRVWLVIDEAHVVAPASEDSPARMALIEYVKRGRDAGLSLVMATQQPSAVDDRILSQVDLSLNHRLTFQSDIAAATRRVPTKTPGNLKLSGSTIDDFGDMLRILDAGQCFIGDHSTSRSVLTQIRPRVTSHGGYSPT